MFHGYATDSVLMIIVGLVAIDAALAFPDRSFDLVCEFAVLHHVARPGTVIDEMNRVASRMIAI